MQSSNLEEGASHNATHGSVCTVTDRRSILQMAAYLLGVSGPAAALAGCQAPAWSLAEAQRSLLAAVADALMPRTDTPGALDAGIPELVEAMLRDWASREHRNEMVGVLHSIDNAARLEQGVRFAGLGADARFDLFSAFDAAHFADDEAYRRLRTLILTLFYLSELGATVELRYEHVPGVWQPSLPITAETRTWASASAY